MASTVVNGILIGSLYALVALGLQQAFAVMRLVNLAYGEFVVVGAYGAWLVSRGLHVDPLLALAIVCPVIGILGYVLQRGLLGPLLSRGLEPPLVATFGLSLILVSLMTQAFSGDSRALDASYATSGVAIAGVQVRVTYLVTFGIAVAIFAAAHVVMTRTRTGAALRAIAGDPDTARTMGVNVEHLYGWTLGLIAAVGAVAGTMIGLSFSFDPSTGASFLLKGFTVMVLGGVESIAGVLVAGIIVGVVGGVGGEVFGGAYQDMVVLIFLLVLLALRPTGLRGREAT
jgi:branched-chain amino acid transport system permease protein